MTQRSNEHALTTIAPATNPIHPAPRIAGWVRMCGCTLIAARNGGEDPCTLVAAIQLSHRTTGVMTLQRFIVTELPQYLANRDRASVAAAVSASGRVFLSGQNALNAEGKVVGLGDPAAQADATLDHIEAALSAAGGSLKHIAKLTVCVVDRDHCKAIHEVVSRRLSGVFPVSTHTGRCRLGAARDDGPDRRRGRHSSTRRQRAGDLCPRPDRVRT